MTSYNSEESRAGVKEDIDQHKSQHKNKLQPDCTSLSGLAYGINYSEFNEREGGEEREGGKEGESARDT